MKIVSFPSSLWASSACIPWFQYLFIYYSPTVWYLAILNNDRFAGIFINIFWYFWVYDQESYEVILRCLCSPHWAEIFDILGFEFIIEKFSKRLMGHVQNKRGMFLWLFVKLFLEKCPGLCYKKCVWVWEVGGIKHSTNWVYEDDSSCYLASWFYW